jgi:hypothetical protein
LGLCEAERFRHYLKGLRLPSNELPLWSAAQDNLAALWKLFGERACAIIRENFDSIREFLKTTYGTLLVIDD